ncbi:MAG: hypothetical protein AAGD22_09770 [Verrucomicrobiota bacterium]
MKTAPLGFLILAGCVFWIVTGDARMFTDYKGAGRDGGEVGAGGESGIGAAEEHAFA